MSQIPGVRETAVPGPLLFARYAYPPNQLGFCGPADTGALLDYGAAGVVDPGLVNLAKAFAGAWPYLELIAAQTGIDDPLDHRVVEAYWVGNDLLGKVPLRAIGDSMDERFRRSTSSYGFGLLTEGVLAGGVPHHSFHVFGVYPWVGLLGADRRAEQALTVLDRCRIRWGRVMGVQGDQVVVRYRPLTWDGRRLQETAEIEETVTRSVDGVGVLADLGPGDWVSLHWHWVCDRLSREQLAALRWWSARQLQITNERLGRSAALI